MAGGGTPIGLAAFVAVKFTGYTLSTFYFRWTNGRRDVRPLVFGGARTALGIVLGIATGALLAALGAEPLFFLVALLPVRVFEWWLVLRGFFRAGDDDEQHGGVRLPKHTVARDARRERLVRDIVVGVAISYALDYLAITAAFVVPGGFWVC